MSSLFSRKSKPPGNNREHSRSLLIIDRTTSLLLCFILFFVWILNTIHSRKKTTSWGSAYGNDFKQQQQQQHCHSKSIDSVRWRQRNGRRMQLPVVRRRITTTTRRNKRIRKIITNKIRQQKIMILHPVKMPTRTIHQSLPFLLLSGIMYHL